MTKITDIYNAITDLLEANLSGYTRLSNPYAPQTNPFPLMGKGFGLAVGPGIDTKRFVGCEVTWQRAFTIILINQMMATENDIDTRELIEQELLNKHDVLRKKFYLDSTLGGKAFNTTVTSDLGISFIAADNELFLGLELNLETEYMENPNS